MLVRRPADSRIKSGDLTHRGKLESTYTNADISSLQTRNRYLVVSWRPCFENLLHKNKKH